MANKPRRHSSELSRRSLLETFGLGGLALSTGACKTDPTPVTLPGRTPRPDALWAGLAPVALDVFPSGIQSGDPKPESLLCWTKFTESNDLTLAVAIWENGAWTELANEPVAPNAEGYIHHIVVGLEPDTPIAFQFIDSDGRGSTVGHSRTAIAEDAALPVRFGATSCTAKAHLDFPSLENLANRFSCDFFMWLGDTVYADDAETYEEYSSFYDYNFNTNGFKAILEKTPGVFSWDDHEVANNWAPDSIDPTRLAVAKKAYFDNLAIAPIPGNPERLWRSFTFGQTLELFVLDCRSERDPENGIYLSREQMEWLKEARGISKLPELMKRITALEKQIEELKDQSS